MPRGVLRLRPGGKGEELGLHVDLAQASNAAGELEECLYAFQDTHVCEADLLFPVSFCIGSASVIDMP